MKLLTAAQGPANRSQHGVIRIGTLNVQSLTGKMPQVITLAETHNLDVLCLQETRLTPDNLLSAQHAAKKAGWQWIAGETASNAIGGPQAGVATLSRWTVDTWSPPAVSHELRAHKARWQLLRLHRPGARPIICINLYLHANNQADAVTLGRNLLELAGSSGEDTLALGDWNRTPEEEPALAPLRSGQLHLADAVDGPEARVTPTRLGPAARHIDYALHSMRVVPLARSQERGVADHALIAYDFKVGALKPFYQVAPPRKLQMNQEVEVQAWDAAFDLVTYHQLLSQDQIQEAWNMLSDSAEQLLVPKPGRKRSAIPKPVQVAQRPVQADRLQSILERRLRRTQRRVLESQKPQAPLSLADKISRDLVYFQKHFPELSELTPHAPQLANAIEDCIAKESAASSEARLHKWRQRMEEDEASLIRWVKGADKTTESATHDMTISPHPQAKAEHFAQHWSQIWNPPSLPQTEAVDRYLTWVPENGYPCPEPSITGTELRKQAKKAVGKASGPDGWNAEAWNLLPQPFFDQLAQLWKAVLRTQKLPHQWQAIRCVLIPKDVGLRPLSVASLAWRTGAAVIIQAISDWIDAWAPPALIGGLKQRYVATAHEELHESFEWRTIYGAKIDLAKCFDTVDYRQALRVWRRLGAPMPLLGVIRSFYDGQTKTMEWQGYTARQAISCARGLLQGCPLSCALLAGLMSVWYWHVKQAALSIRISVYIDDRTLWAQELEPLQRSLEASNEVDEALGLTLNQAKCELFVKASRHKHAAARDWNETSGRRWKVSKAFKLLGVHYNLSKARRTPLDAKVIEKVQARLRRLRLATRKQARKRKLVGSLILSLFTHTGPWTTIPGKYLSKWRTAIEAAVLGSAVTGRSRYLLWTGYLRPKLDPEFALDSKVITHQLWRVRQHVSRVRTLEALEDFCAQPEQNSCGRMAEVLSKWRWRQVTATRFDTPHGQIDLASDGESAIFGAMKKAWEASIWRAEPRADHALAEGRALEYPVTKAHVQGIRGGLSTDQEAFLVVTAAGKDSRKLAKQLKLDKIECLCGREWPSKTHVTWYCEQVHLQEVDRPQSRHEERLLLRTIQHPPPPPAHTGRLDQCNHALSQTFAQQEGVILAATDGSSKLAGPERRASWSVATSNGVHAFAREGHDQSIFTAEAWAVLQAFLAANHAAKPLRLICDNLSVVRQVQKIHAGGQLPRWGPQDCGEP